MAEETLAYLKNKFVSGNKILSPWKISKTIRRACETLGETLEKADIDIILEDFGELAEEKLLNKLILRRVSGCMDDKAYEWLLEKYGSYGLDAASANGMLKETHQSLERKLTKDDVKVVLEELKAGVTEAKDVINRVIDMALSKKSFANTGLRGALKQQGITLEQFQEWKLMGADGVSKEQAAIMKAIREAVPDVTKDTMMKKIIPIEDVGNYLGDEGRSTIRGYVARYNDVSHLRGYDEVVESMRLDYKTAAGVRPYPEGGNSYAYIKFQTTDYADIEIPFGKTMGGTNTDGYPCTLNGFLASRNGEVIPEFQCIEGKRIKPIKGAELHTVVNGKNTVVGIFDGSHFREVK